jgi:hypothetical protein
LADGGLLGLVLFFAASGFGVTSSPRIRTESFVAWMRRRLSRLYPAVIITVFLFGMIANRGWQNWNLEDYFRQFIYPTQYHFIAKIIPFYVVLFTLAQIQFRWKYWSVGGALFIASLAFAWPDMRELWSHPMALRTGQLAPSFLWLIFLLPTVLAAAIADNSCRFYRPLSKADGLLLLLGAAGYAIFKVLISKLGMIPWLFPCYFAIAIAFSFQLFRIASHPQFVEWLKTLPLVWSCTTWLSTISLESYVVHIQMMHWKVWQRFPFPISLLLFAAAAWSCAHIVHRLAKRVALNRNRVT